MIEVSARHVHLSEKHLKVLFNKRSLTKVKDLSQPGQFLSQERVAIVGEKSEFKNVAILGPCRKETQVEISMTDCIKLGIPPVIRESGFLKNSSPCKIVGPEGEISLKQGVIVAKRHIHMPLEIAKKFNLKDQTISKVSVKTDQRSLIFDDVVIRISEKFSLAMHVDTDEGNAFSYKSGISGEILI